MIFGGNTGCFNVAGCVQNNIGFPKNYLRQRSYLRPPKIPTTPNGLASQKPTADLKCQPCSKRPPTWAHCRSGACAFSLLSPRANLKGEAGGRCDGMSSSRPLSSTCRSSRSTSCLLRRCHGDRFLFFLNFHLDTDRPLARNINRSSRRASLIPF